MFKKIFGKLFSTGTLQAESTTHTASASLSADALHDLEMRKRAIVADITRLAAELAACPDLGAPIGGAPIGFGTLAGGLASANPAPAASNPTSSSAGAADMIDWNALGAKAYRLAGIPLKAEASRAYNEGLDRAARPYPRPATLAEAAEYLARQKGAK